MLDGVTEAVDRTGVDGLAGRWSVTARAAYPASRSNINTSKATNGRRRSDDRNETTPPSVGPGGISAGRRQRRPTDIEMKEQTWTMQ